MKNLNSQEPLNASTGDDSLPNYLQEKYKDFSKNYTCNLAPTTENAIKLLSHRAAESLNDLDKEWLSKLTNSVSDDLDSLSYLCNALGNYSAHISEGEESSAFFCLSTHLRILNILLNNSIAATNELSERVKPETKQFESESLLKSSENGESKANSQKFQVGGDV